MDKDARIDRLVGVVNELLELFESNGTCDCGSILCAVCQAQRVLNSEYKIAFPDEKTVPFTWLEREEIE